MTVEESGAGSTVRIQTDFTVAGRVAQFGRGVMEDVSRRLIGQMADCIKSQLESGEAAAAAAGGGEGPQPAAAGGTPASATQPASAPAAAPPAAQPVNALSLFFAVLWDRIRRLFGRRA
jgi:hypothetical protein